MYGAGIPWDELTIVTAADIPGCQVLSRSSRTTSPTSHRTALNHPEEPVLLLAHPDKTLLEEARRARSTIPRRSDCRRCSPLTNRWSGAEVIRGRGQYLQELPRGAGGRRFRLGARGGDCRGRVRDRGAGAALHRAERHDRRWRRRGGVTVWGSMQCPYYVHNALTALFGLPAGEDARRADGNGRRVRRQGGIPVDASPGTRRCWRWKSGRPVKLIYDRAEDMVATTKRHPSRTRHRTAVDARRATRGDGHRLRPRRRRLRDAVPGRLVARHHPRGRSLLLSQRAHARPRCRHQRAAARRVPRVRRAAEHLRARAPHGPRRGSRRPHAGRVPPAQLHPTGPDAAPWARSSASRSTWRRCSIGAGAVRLPRQAARLRAGEQRRSAIKRGIGFAAFMHGAGFTGSGEDHLASVVAVEATADGRVRVLAASTEIGQGTNTIFSQIVADALGIDVRRRRGRAARHRGGAEQRPDGRVAHLHGGRQADRVGRARTEGDAREAGCLPASYSPDEFHAACAAYVAQHGSLRASAQYAPREGAHWDDEQYQGDAYGSYAWAVYVAEVSVDMTTFEIARRGLRRAAGSRQGDQPGARRPARSKEASRRRSAGRSPRTSSGATVAWPTRR